ncbi:hypothetical protein Q31b_57240 [Novipirellula aureliae]|uniref:Uncharacterized protein n=1 Tax=Novipirellula aureliae TaxID=2527966 RepID=A0A5C6DD20_9BACT|nr:hypothetical protein [Novipirellula aureliae]TWU33667.1 hypothetical protein Q31b_57240 [Novipirellula aureliae]
MNVQAVMGIVPGFVLCLAGSAAYAGGSTRSIDGKTGLETRSDSMDDPKALPIPFPDNLEQQELEVHWSPIKTDALGNKLMLSGKLLQVDDADTAVPLCNQPFSIYLARQHDKRLDWSKKAGYDETMMVDGLSDENGDFVGSAELSETDLSLDKFGKVQIAIAPATIARNGQTRWVKDL